MARPGTEIIIRETPPVRSAPTDTGVWHVIGITEKGPTEPQHVQSMADYVRIFGSRVSYGMLYDALDSFFHEGGREAYVSRVVGPTPVNSFVVLNDAGAAPSLRVEALGPGAWGNDLNVQIVAGTTVGSFIVVVSHDTLGELERSPELVDKPAALGWAQYSDYIRLTDLASLNDPAAGAAQSLASGADDRANIVDAQWQTALDKLTTDLGPGQVSAPGRTTAAAHAQLLAHAVTNNRSAILDPPNTATAATLLAAAAADRGNGRHGAMFAPWLNVPGLTGGTVRTVPPSGVVAGIIARNDARTGNPNVPAAGQNGQSQYTLSLSVAAWTDAQRESLNDMGVNVIRMMYGGARVYGWRSLADPGSLPAWANFGNSRLFMAISAEANNIAERYVLSEIDGRGATIGAFQGDLTAMLVRYYNEGALYGPTPTSAFIVDVGPTVNPPAKLAQGELRAVIGLRMSPFAEMVILELVKVAITEAVA